MFFSKSINVLRAAAAIAKHPLPGFSTSALQTNAAKELLRRCLSTSTSGEQRRRLEGQRAIVTGGSKGIGKAIALGYAREGADLVFTYASDEKNALEVVKKAEEFKVKAKAVKFDLLVPEDAKKLLRQSVDFMGGVDILVNNAASLGLNNNFFKHFLVQTEEDLQASMDNFLISPMRLTQAVCRQMILQKMGGSIVNISSTSSKKTTTPTHVSYAVGKAGLNRFTQALAAFMAQYEIRVNTISPWPTETSPVMKLDETLRKSLLNIIPLHRIVKPENIQEFAILFATNKSITGAEIVIDGGYVISSVMPRELLESMNKQALQELERKEKEPQEEQALASPSSKPGL